jgi:hypothetical protein
VLVVLGAASTTAAGCGGHSSHAEGAGNPAAGGGAGGGAGAGAANVAGSPELAFAGSFSIDAAGASGKSGSEGGAPSFGGEGGSGARTPCEHDQQYLCYSNDCFCDANAPLSKDDCGFNFQFECMSYDPPTGCTCSYITGPK